MMFSNHSRIVIRGILGVMMGNPFPSRESLERVQTNIEHLMITLRHNSNVLSMCN